MDVEDIILKKPTDKLEKEISILIASSTGM